MLFQRRPNRFGLGGSKFRRQRQPGRIQTGWTGFAARHRLIDVGFRARLKEIRQGLRAPDSRLSRTHKLAPVADVGAHKIGGLSGAAYKAFGARDLSARIIDRGIRRIAHRAIRLSTRGHPAHLPRPKHLGLRRRAGQHDDRGGKQESSDTLHG